mmetsp:Transcript_31584/g.53065  ORF Transcript_31584/g.53065 Transcript_31584/m.53065 type:complete len:283 (-) Transcript_31584:394-1242(-)
MRLPWDRGNDERPSAPSTFEINPHHRQQLRAAATQAADMAGHAFVSIMAFSSVLSLTQVTGLATRVSSATPLLGSALGAVGVGVASICAARSAEVYANYRVTGRLPKLDWRDLTQKKIVQYVQKNRDSLIMDAIIGIVVFKALGGRVQSLLPSDLGRVGAHARASLPANGASYADQTQRAKLQQLFKKFGCHHCGTRRGTVIGDHMPPNRIAHGSTSEIAARSSSWWAWLRRPPLQRYYPQCQDCSGQQSSAMRHNRRILKYHYNLWYPPVLAGAVVGMQYY